MILLHIEMQVNNLPVEIQNKIFYFLEHPTATIIKESYDSRDNTYWTLRNGIYGGRGYSGRDEEYWNDFIRMRERDKKLEERMREWGEMERMEEEDINYKYLIHPISRGFKLAHRYALRSLDYKWRKNNFVYDVWRRLDKDEKRNG